MSARGMENGFPGDRRPTHSEPKLQWAWNLLQVTEAIQKKTLCFQPPAVRSSTKG
jgi:hypothetical protein